VNVLLSLRRRLKVRRDLSARQELRTISLKEIQLPKVSYAELVSDTRLGQAELFPGVRVARTARWQIEAPPECEQQVNALRDCFTADWGAGIDPGYAANAMTLTRLNDVFIGMPSGICVTADGILIDETAQVARGIDPSLADAPFISLSDNTFIPGDYVAVTEPVLHCFHRASGAYGHFLFDALPMIALCREPILAGRLKLLMRDFPNWAYSMLQAFGIRRRHIVSIRRGTIRCKDVLIANTLTTLNTFLPNPDLCKLPAKATEVDIATRWKSRDVGSRIYLSRENQNNYFARSVENEEELRTELRALGFAILEPANMRFGDQVHAINNASMIVGAHGSGFGNLIFARPGTHVIDLMPRDWVGFFGQIGGPERWLFNVTTAFDLDYTVLLCRSRVFQHLPDSDTSGLQKRGIAATVDLDLLRRVIATLRAA
jgi:capsular polysaccharide biosynthesis protein